MLEDLKRVLESRSVRRYRGGPYGDSEMETMRRNIPSHHADFILALLEKNPEFAFKIYVQMIVKKEQGKIKRDIDRVEDSMKELKKKVL